MVNPPDPASPLLPLSLVVIHTVFRFLFINYRHKLIPTNLLFRFAGLVLLLSKVPPGEFESPLPP